jgi:hypothetical protein
MQESKESADSAVTYNHWRLAQVYYPILLDLALRKERATYGELVASAKVKHPDVPEVQRAISVTVGRTLNAVRKFTSDKHPDLSCLIYSKATGRCGEPYTQQADEKAAIDAVFAFDGWLAAREGFDDFKDEQPSAAAPTVRKPANGVVVLRKAAAYEAAKKRMWDHYDQNRDQYPKAIGSQREKIVQAILSGVSVEDAFRNAKEKLPPSNERHRLS